MLILLKENNASSQPPPPNTQYPILTTPLNRTNHTVLSSMH